MTEKFPLISIITVNYNGSRFLEPFFNSLAGLDYPREKLEVIMVDNDSGDGSVELIGQKYPYVNIIKNNLNNYCKANNLGIRAAKGEYVALVNNDVKVDKDWLPELFKVISHRDDIGAATSKVLFMDGTLQGTGHYQFPNFYWSDRGFKESDDGQYDDTQEVQSVSHCAVLYRKKCLDDVGFLDEDFNMYMEDIDMSIRVRQKKWKLFYAHKSIAYHEFHGTADEKRAKFYCERNRLLLIAKHFPERLGDELFGRGYFTVLNKNGLAEILPLVLAKLTKHYDENFVNSMLPGLFEGINKILNFEKDYLIKEIDSGKNKLSSLQEAILQSDQEIFQLNERIKQVSDMLSQKDQVIHAHEEELSGLKGKELPRLGEVIRQKDSEISQLREKIGRASDILIEKEKHVARKEQIIREQEREISSLNNEIKRIYNSATYRFIVRPVLWPVFSAIKSFLKIFVEFKKIIVGLLTFLKSVSRDKSVSLAHFSTSSAYAQYAQPNVYFIKVTNQGFGKKTVKIGFDIYKYDNFRHPDGHYAYFFAELTLDSMKTASLEVDYNWEGRVIFSIAGRTLEVVDFWRNKISGADIYSLQAVIRNFEGRLIDKLEIFQKLKR